MARLTRVFARPIRLLGRSSAAILCALLIGMFYLATIRDGHVWDDDFSMYIHHAQNLARGEPYADTGYIYNPQNPAIGPRVYPPGFPLLLAPVVRMFGLDLRPMKILVIGFFVGSLLLTAALFRSVLPAPYVTALVLVVGLNPFFWEFKDHVLSDLPFLFFVLLSFICSRRQMRPTPHGVVAPRSRWRRVLRPTRPTPPGHWRLR
jgi:4-amino-4-deoxy-L-arabinose transferase-like glycosyltransferase